MKMLSAGADLAIVDSSSGRTISRRDLLEIVDQRNQLIGQRSLVFLFADNSIRSLVWFLAAVQGEHPVALLDPGLPSAMASTLVELYRPDIVIHASPAQVLGERGGQSLTPDAVRLQNSTGRLHPDLSILLTTSGSTGSPKFVRLSRRNIESNTAAIIESLGLTDADRAITTLPLYYSYGMSIALTHLCCGGSIVITQSTLMEQAFWNAIREYRPTSMGGVPTSYHILRRLGMDRLEAASIRSLTQAGGKLEPTLVKEFHELMERQGGKFFVMYGQTEASPRIACLPPNHLPEKLGSVGKVLSGGSVEIVDIETNAALPVGAVGRIVYRGPNVMMGYAQGEADLARGDEMRSRLDTGDLGYLDEDGCLFITGRLKRIAKVHGERVNLDEMSAIISSDEEIAVVAAEPDRIIVFLTQDLREGVEAAHRRASEALRLPYRSITFTRIDALPRTSSGKTDYRMLEAIAANVS